MPFAGFLMKRIGSEFVDRHTESGRRRDAMRVLRRAEKGHSLVFFPEGTFDEIPGLKRFQSGHSPQRCAAGCRSCRQSSTARGAPCPARR